MEIRRKGDGQLSVDVLTDSWYGSRRHGYLYSKRELAFPGSWDVTVFEPHAADDMRPMSPDEVRRALQQPIGSEPLRRLAEGRRTAAIVIDDLTRPTPSFAIVPLILEELEAGGIGAVDTRIVVGLGTHRPITRAEMRRKLGRDVVEGVEVINHNAFTRRITRFSRPNGEPDFGIHQAVGEADLKITVGAVTPHGGAGFGGGAKAFLPAVAECKSIMYNHQKYTWEGPGIDITSTCIRRDMEVVAAAAGLDFSVNAVVSPAKDVLGVFAGHFIEAHRAGCVLADRMFRTPVPQETLDVVVTAGYPFDTDIGQSHRGSWPEKHSAVSVLVAVARDAWAYHGDNGTSWRAHQRGKRQQQPLDAYRFRGVADAQGDGSRHYYSPTVDAGVFYERQSNRTFHSCWDETVRSLGGDRQGVTVGVFPFASTQLEDA
ncbi:lactate racemase domain-containing protein [Candidatus Latescibacterota bacterium]